MQSMKRNVLIIGVFLIVMGEITYAQNAENDFVINAINKQVNEYPNKFDLNSPLNSFITFKYLQSDGWPV